MAKNYPKMPTDVKKCLEILLQREKLISELYNMLDMIRENINDFFKKRHEQIKKEK